MVLVWNLMVPEVAANASREPERRRDLKGRPSGVLLQDLHDDIMAQAPAYD